tara:strand:+ start:1676 stop:1918 length:243 start_codon:yes stop_codon:yes gene_type:complete
MKTDFDSVLALLQKNKAKKMKEGFTTREFAAAVNRADAAARHILKQLLENGLAVFVGKEAQPNICGGFNNVPIYKLTPRK